MGFTLPLAFDLAGVFLFALTGAMTAIRRGFDVVGVFTVAGATGLGGGVLRDVLLGTVPPASLREPRFLVAAGSAALVGWVFGARIDRFRPAFTLLDALGLGAYAAVGAQKALAAGLGGLAAALLGVVTAVGGGVLRDLLSREAPLTFLPGHVYTLAALAAAGAYVLLSGSVAPSLAALVAVALAVALRGLSLRLDWRTRHRNLA
jgi:uncharacterized membrane protein YeiH